MATVSKSKYEPVSSVSSSSGISSRPIGQEEETKEPLPGEIPPATAAAVNNDLESNFSPGISQGTSTQESEIARLADAHKRVQQGLPHDHRRNSRWSSWKWGSSWRSQPANETVGQKVLYCGLGFCQLVILIAVFVFVIILIVLLVSYLTPKKHSSKPPMTTTTDDNPPPPPTEPTPPAAMIMEFLINEVFNC
jgi:hypothetical protein